LQNNIFSGLFVGQNLITLKEVDSTNTYLKDLLSKSKPLPEGTVIMAEEQFAGRGQQLNKWHSDPGKNLTFSVLLNPQFLPLLNQFDLTRVISLGIADALKPLLGESVKIKWPNDIYYEDKKLGGVLVENMVKGSVIKHAIIGIGLNINQGSFPSHLPHAISLKQILHTDYDLKMLLSEICKNIEAYYLKLKAGKFEILRKEYLSRLFWLNENKTFSANGQMFEGRIRDVEPNGLLLLDVNGRDQLYNLKEIEFLK
jgi:BirA family biotin operon repressor/biotin-[acetyl-CoA-carboxylase] ligase